ncbi:MAG: amino acid adenylation domain-containing protein [Desulfamplus sp.]|nr:amino acid adenylation domain-containing protein [Desulfamplus sp.]
MFDKRNVKNLYALTPLQEGILFHSLMDQGGATYFEQACFNVTGAVNIPMFEQAWNELIRRHDVLRTIFVLKNVPQPLQVVLKQRSITIRVEDITHLKYEEQNAKIEAFRVQDRNTPFDLTKDLLIRVNLFKRNSDFHTLVWSFHHIIMDGWSVSVLYEELALIYTALSQGKKFNLPEPIQFNAYIRWLKGRNNQIAQEFWQNYLNGYKRATGLPRIEKTTQELLDAKFTTNRLKFEMSSDISKELNDLSLHCQVTVNTLFQALWGIVMASYNNATDAVFGVTVSGRPTEIQGVERMVGLFINAVPVRIRYYEGDTFEDLLTRLQSESTAARDFHYCSLADIQASTPLRQNLFDQLLVFENYPDPSDVLGESQMALSLTNFDQFEQTNYDLTVEVFPGSTIGYDIMFNPAVFEEALVKLIPTHLERAASAVIADKSIMVDAIAILTPDEAKIYQSYIRKDIEEVLINSLDDSNNDYKDRKILTQFVAPQNDIQQKLVDIWQEILEKNRIGIDDNFFEIGGHSLRATRIISRIHKISGVEITLQEFFRHTDIRTLSSLIEVKSSPNIKAVLTIPTLPSKHDYEASHAQRRLWILDKMEESFTAYNQSAGFLFKGKFEPKLFKEAIEFVANRHESLRTVFVEKANEPYQKILDNPKLLISEIDLSQEIEPKEAACKLATRLPNQVFDLTNGPLWSATVLKLSDIEHVILLNMHHIICDGWSLVILENEVLTLYQMLIKGQKLKLPPLALQYKDFAAWQNSRLASSELDKHRAYWHEKLKGEIPVLNLPTDFPRPLVRTYSGSVVRIDFLDDEIAPLINFCNSQRVSLFMGLVAILKVVLFRYTSQEDIIIGSPVAGRDHADLENQIGFFVNTLALRDAINPEMRFSELLKEVAVTVTDAFDHQLYPFDRLVEELNVLRDVGRSPIFDVMLVVQNNIKVEASIPNLTISEFDFELKQSQFDLTLIFSQNDNRMRLDINYNSDLFAKETIERLSSHFKSVILSATKEPETAISRLNMLTQDEYKMLTSGFSSHTRLFPYDKTLVELFEEQAKKTPDGVAVIYQDKILSYRELNNASNALGYYLRKTCNIKSDMPVAVLLNRSEKVPSALIGVLKSGGTYLPLDPESPIKRLEYILCDSGAEVIITASPNLELAGRLNPKKIVDIGDSSIFLDNSLDGLEESNLTHTSMPTDLAYIIYTSGSTGEPKGVMVEHRSFVNMILAQIEGFEIKSDERVLQFATLMFDASMSEIFMALLCGAAVVMIDKEQIQDTAQFIDYMQKKEITAITLPPVYLKMLPRNSMPHLKVLITAGEPAIKEDALFYSQTKRYFNAYGPTETSVCTSFHRVDPNRIYTDTIPVGPPIANNAVFILDKHLNPVPIGISGELCFAGVGLARGYLKRDDLTAEKFIDNPFTDQISNIFSTIDAAANRRIYRIGDLGRWLPTGDIEFLGRVDEQVKIRGFRIEPGEISTALKKFADVKDALVTVWRDEDANNQLAAYIVTKSRPSSSALKSHLSELLPPYMIPSLFILLDAFPLTINGKIDKRALPDPAKAMQDQIKEAANGAKSQPVSLLEAKILSVWQTLFNRDATQKSAIGRNDDFFTLGGDSIKAIRMVALLREEGIIVRVKDIFKWTTVADLAKHGAKFEDSTQKLDIKIESEFSGQVTQTPIYLWFFNHFKAHANHFNHADIFYSKTHLKPSSIEATINAVVNHHDMLRLSCSKATDSSSVEIIVHTKNDFIDKSNNPIFEVINLRDFDLKTAKKEIGQIADKAQSSFDLLSPPLIKFILFQLSDGDRLFIVMHHLLGDAVSWRILLEDLESAYNQHQAGQTIMLPQKSDPFAVWAKSLEEYALSRTLEAEKDYWSNLMQTITGRLPMEEAKEHKTSFMADMAIFEMQLSVETTKKLKQAAINLNTGVDKLLLAPLAWCFRCQHSQSSTLISLESYGRPELFDNINVSRTIGWFTAVYPIVINASDIDGLEKDAKKESIKNDIIKIDQSIKLTPNSGIGWGLLKYLNPKVSEILSSSSYKESNINFNYLGEFEAYGRGIFKPASEDSGLSVAKNAPITHDLDINAAIAQGALHIVWNYNSRAFTEARIKKMVQDFSIHLESIFEE